MVDTGLFEVLEALEACLDALIASRWDDARQRWSTLPGEVGGVTSRLCGHTSMGRLSKVGPVVLLMAQRNFIANLQPPT